MKRFPRFCIAPSVALLMFPCILALAAGPVPQAVKLDVQKQVLSQGPMLLGSLRQAREAGLRRDPWGMTYSLQEAQRLLDAMAGAEASVQSTQPSAADRSPTAAPVSGETAPVGEPIELDRPESGGREQAVGRFEGDAGTIPLKPVKRDLDRALTALRANPPTLGTALLATDDALRQVHWEKGLEPKDWAAARDQVLEGYALALDSRPEARTRLAGAQRTLAALEGGGPFAQRLSAAQSGPTPDLEALGQLVRDLDSKVSSLRDSAEVGR